MAMGVHRHSRRGHRRRAAMAEINVTPLVDVMLVLLIIFMITAPLLSQGVPLDLPDAKAKALDLNEQPIEISLTRNGRLYIGEEEIRIGTLEDRLAAIKARGGAKDPPAIILRADKGLDYGAVMAVLSALNRAGLSKVSLLTAGDDQG